MRWGILLGSPDISGGTYVIFEHAIRAKRRGADVTIITEEKVNMSRLQWHPEAKELNWVTFEEAKDMEFDIAIATWWRTVYELYRIQAKQYAYFVQSIESRFYDEPEKPLRKLVDATYTLPLNIITEAKWIKQYLKGHYDKDATLVLNGIRKDIYNLDGECHKPRDKEKLRVLVEGPVDVPFKNVAKTIQLCKESLADEVWLLTSSPVKSVEGVDRVFSRVPIFETPKIYRSCDIIIKLSYVEGMFGPPLEMFHCGGTSITYNVTGYDEYIEKGVNGLVANKDDDKKVIEFINELKQNREMLNKLKDNAIQTAEKWPEWEDSSLKFEEAVNNIIQNKHKIKNRDIEIQSKFMFDYYVIAEDYKNLSGNTKNSKAKLKVIIKTKAPRIYDLLRNIKWKIKGRRL